MRTVMKFDVGADGFKKMMVVLAITAGLLLLVGIIFLNMVLKDVRQM